MRVVAPTDEHWITLVTRPPSMIVVAAPFLALQRDAVLSGAHAQILRIRPIAHEHDVAESGDVQRLLDRRVVTGHVVDGRRRGRGEQDGREEQHTGSRSDHSDLLANVGLPRLVAHPRAPFGAQVGLAQPA
jgi:hypothetical protein